MEETSWRRHQGGGIREEAPGRRHQGGDIIEGGIMEEAPWRRHHGGGISGASRKHLRDIWKASTLGFPPLSRRCLLEAQGLLTNTVRTPSH